MIVLGKKKKQPAKPVAQSPRAKTCGVCFGKGFRESNKLPYNSGPQIRRSKCGLCDGTGKVKS